MKVLFSKCGATCSSCPAYRGNVSYYEDQQRCSDGWHKYLGVRLHPDRCYCDGCQTPDEEQPTLVIGKYGCRLRKCAVKNGVATCAHCSGYPCLAVRTQFSFDAGSRERISARLGAPVPEEEYLAFIEPYECHRHLDEIRATLRPAEIVEMTRVEVKPRLAAFPGDLPLSAEETATLRAIHRMLGEVGVAEGISYAEQAILTERRRNLVRLVWAFGRYGEPAEEDGTSLVLDAETYLAQKIESEYAKLQGYMETLAEHSVHCEHFPLVEEGWRTPRGSLRRKGWLLSMSFGDEVGGVAALEALRRYATRLDERYGKGAFRRFSRADMRVLGEG
jgi:hypothetical protein